MKTAYLLYDSFHQNTGDIAIGIALKKYFEQNNCKTEIVNPFESYKYKNQTTIIGGGDLLHNPNHPFYLQFRLTGSHILNSVGISSDEDLNYLNEYKYLSVRSTGDKEKIQNKIKNVKIVPCTTMLLTPSKKIKHKQPTVGFHFHYSSYFNCRNITQTTSLFKGYKKLAIPFTHYNNDKAVMEKMFADTDIEIMDILPPQDILNTIASLDLFICSSLHAAMFAYICNVPFLVFPYYDKINFFLNDRSLNQSAFNNKQELLEKTKLILNDKPDYGSIISKDLQNLHDHLKTITGLIPSNIKFIKPNNSSNISITNLENYTKFLMTNNQINKFEEQEKKIKCEQTIKLIQKENVNKQKSIEELQKSNLEKQKSIEELQKSNLEKQNYIEKSRKFKSKILALLHK